MHVILKEKIAKLGGVGDLVRVKIIDNKKTVLDQTPITNGSFIAIDPNLVAETVARLPPKLPIGVRIADTITTSFIIIIFMNLYLVRIYVNYLYFSY